MVLFDKPDYKKDFIDTASVPVIVAKPDGKIVYANRAAGKIFSIECSVFTELNLTDIFDSFCPSKIKENWILLKKEKTLTFYEDIIDSDNEKHRIIINSNYHSYENDELRVLFITDITNEFCVNENLRLHKDILEHLYDSVFIFNEEECKVVYVNSSGCKKLGYTQLEMMGMNVARFARPADSNKSFDEIKKYLDAHNGHLTVKLFSIRKDGTEFPTDMTVTRYKKDDANYCISIMRDVTERVMIENELKKDNEFLEQMVSERTVELERQKEILEQKVVEETDKRLNNERLLLEHKKFAEMGQVMSAIGHQWRQPLNTLGLCIQDIVETVSEGNSSPEYLEQMESHMMALLESMSGTIDNFRKFFEPEGSEHSFDTREIITDIIKMMEARVESEDTEISFLCNCTNPCTLDNRSIEHACIRKNLNINGHMTEFKQVVMNLIYNSLDAIHEYHEKNNTKGIIDIRVIASDRELEIIISDNGPGIDAESINKIFNPYYTTKDEGQGTGLGLYTAKSFVEHMGGIIYAENTDTGAKFTIKLPRTKPNHEDKASV